MEIHNWLEYAPKFVLFHTFPFISSFCHYFRFSWALFAWSISSCFWHSLFLILSFSVSKMLRSCFIIVGNFLKIVFSAKDLLSWCFLLELIGLNNVCCGRKFFLYSIQQIINSECHPTKYRCHLKGTKTLCENWNDILLAIDPIMCILIDWFANNKIKKWMFSHQADSINYSEAKAYEDRNFHENHANMNHR